MKRFLLKLLFFLIPSFILLIGTEMLLRNIPNDYQLKNDFLVKNSNKIEKLFLGSSHAYYGINPDFISGYSFNASHISQSISLDYEIFKKYENDWKELEYVAIPIDYFSLFFDLSASEESWRIKNYNIYYDLNISNNISDYFEVLSLDFSINLKRIYSYFVLNQSSVTSSNLGYGIDYRENIELENSGKKAAKRHTYSDFSYQKENIKVLNKFLDLALKNDFKVILYTSPAYNSYISNLYKQQLLQTESICKSLSTNRNNCTYFNLLENEHFNSSDFRDADHLNEEGAKKLSILLDQLITEF